MKKAILIFVSVFGLMVLSACSFTEEVNNSLEYATVVQEQVNRLSGFAEEAPQMFTEALTNPEAQEELESQLNALKTELLNFNEIQSPSLAEGIHEQLIAKNEALLEEINKMIDNGNLVIDNIENSQIFNTINDIIGLLNRIENLGL